MQLIISVKEGVESTKEFTCQLFSLDQFLSLKFHNENQSTLEKLEKYI